MDIKGKIRTHYIEIPYKIRQNYQYISKIKGYLRLRILILLKITDTYLGNWNRDSRKVSENSTDQNKQQKGRGHTSSQLL